MNLTDDETLELNELCNALVDGAISPVERARLERWLATSEEARKFYVRAMALSASLCDYAGEMQAEAPDAPARILRPALWQWGLGALAAAASVMLAFWLGGRPESPSRADAEAEESVAWLSGGKDCKWIAGDFKTGDELRRGQRIELASGFAEITFDCGAQVTLEGPASLDLTSAWEAVLDRGTLRARVPAEAIGFRISNPQVDVVDLGTEFTMVADTGGGTEVYVLKGAVEAAAREGGVRGRDAIVLHEKQARRFAKSGVSEVKDRDQKMARFVRKVALDRLTHPAGYVHWSFDETTGSLARAELLGPARGDFDAQLLAPLGAMHGPGRINGGLRFDGSFCARASFAGIGQRTARTVAFWVKAPDDAQLPEAGPMLAWPLNGKDSRPVEIAWNRDPNRGSLGALRTRVGRNFLVGSTPVRDGRWHHVGVVFGIKGKADGLPQIKHYVDGRLDAPAARHWLKQAPGANDPADSSEETLWIGGSNAERFRGELDELFVADRALKSQEIRHLMQHNAPAPAEMLAAE